LQYSLMIQQSTMWWPWTEEGTAVASLQRVQKFINQEKIR
jgi:hypothetical protein